MCELEKIKSQAKATDDISAVDEVIEKAKYHTFCYYTYPFQYMQKGENINSHILWINTSLAW